MEEDKQYVMGVDLGGTNTVVGIVDQRGDILTHGSIKTGKNPDINLYINDLSKLIQELIEQTKTQNKIVGIGVGTPNGNYFSGSIEFAPNLPWEGIIPFAKLLQDKVGIPVVLTNDANAAAIGEMTYGAARGMKDFIEITLGTGVGSGIVVNGQIVYGHDGFAGELGHVIVKPGNGRLCGCGRTGCLETYTSATGVARTAREYLDLNPNRETLLRNYIADEITSKDVYDCAMAGDEMSKEIFRYTGEILGQAFANFVAFSSPEAIILFGGLAKAGDLILKPAKEVMERNMLKIFKNKVKLLTSQLKESDAAVLGASALGWEAN